VFLSDRQVFAPYNDETDWRIIAEFARNAVKIANGEMVTAGRTAT
jgi:hypothetical protein